MLLGRCRSTSTTTFRHGKDEVASLSVALMFIQSTVTVHSIHVLQLCVPSLHTLRLWKCEPCLPIFLHRGEESHKVHGPTPTRTVHKTPLSNAFLLVLSRLTSKRQEQTEYRPRRHAEPIGNFYL